MTAADKRQVQVIRGRYVDSVRLLRISESLQSTPGIIEASVVMGTPMNVEFLTANGFEIIAAGPEDLVVAFAGTPEGIQAALEQLPKLLMPATIGTDTVETRSHSTSGALKRHPGSRIVVVAVPGRYAALEAWDALRAGADVFIFSDNVTQADELALKEYASRRGLLVMGPDCGTAIVDGVGLGFANRVRVGSIGLVGASGTGIQQVSCRIHASGEGIAAALGTGGRDLSVRIGGLSTLTAIERLESDPKVDRIGLISKPADPDVARKLLDRLAATGKPAVACLLGLEMRHAKVQIASNLSMAADLLCESDGIAQEEEPEVSRGKLAGIFSGGTLCEEAKRVAAESGVDISGFVDVGADEYTQGRAHPMIDPRLRSAMIAEAGDSVDAILFDVVLGDLAHCDPAGAITPAVDEARERARARGVEVRFYASLIGTELDPQNIESQRSRLVTAGVHVSDRNFEASRMAIRSLGAQSSEPGT